MCWRKECTFIRKTSPKGAETLSSSDQNQLWHGNITGKLQLGKQIGEFLSPGAEIWLFKKWTVPLISQKCFWTVFLYSGFYFELSQYWLFWLCWDWPQDNGTGRASQSITELQWKLASGQSEKVRHGGQSISSAVVCNVKFKGNFVSAPSSPNRLIRSCHSWSRSHRYFTHNPIFIWE